MVWLVVQSQYLMYNYKLREEKIEEITRIERRRKEVPIDQPDDVPIIPIDERVFEKEKILDGKIL